MILVCCRETGISNISFCEIVEILGLSRITRGQLEIPQSFQTLEKSLDNKYIHHYPGLFLKRQRAAGIEIFIHKVKSVLKDLLKQLTTLPLHISLKRINRVCYNN